MIRALLLDIEGTTTPIDFVYNVLFPYAKAHAREYLISHWRAPEVQQDIDGLLRENAEDAEKGTYATLIEGEVNVVDALALYVAWLIDRDKKITSLKSLQGKIWEEGYKKGDVRGQVFEDVPPAFRHWTEQGKTIYIYSSGSVLAQKLLFGSTDFGDLTLFISGYFDTNIGAKKELESYTRIASELRIEPSSLLFVSDVAAELDAAALAGLQTALCIRPGNPTQSSNSTHKTIESFRELSD